MISSDRIAEFDPNTGKFTEYPMPTLGTKIRHIQVDSSTDPRTVWVPYIRTNKIMRCEGQYRRRERQEQRPHTQVAIVVDGRKRDGRAGLCGELQGAPTAFYFAISPQRREQRRKPALAVRIQKGISSERLRPFRWRTALLWRLGLILRPRPLSILHVLLLPCVFLLQLLRLLQVLLL
jgi:hypothetical protein